MDSELWRRLRAAYDRALDAPEAERARLLDELRLTDPELAGELAKLLAANAASSDVLDKPLVRLALVDLEPGVVLCGRFRLLRRIGHGGMGDVWAARDQKLNEDVAVKTIRADLAQEPQQLARLKRELLLARRVAHPSVCKVFDLYDHVAEPHPLSFLTMELIEGETLAERLAREKRLPFGDAVRIVRDIAEGLAAAHTAGVVHRDLKPANIMLTAGERGRRTVILDFGLAREPARIESDGATVFGTLVGTPEYMAPEQISGAAVTPSTDLYALGLMFFEMLDGTRPFAGVSTPDSWMRRAREGPKPLSGSVDGVRARTDAVIRKCLAYEPGERYQSAGELLGALSGMRLSFVLPDDRRVWVAVAALVLAVLGASAFGAWRVYSPQLPPAEAMKWFEEAQQALAEGASVRALNDVNRAIELAPWFAPSYALLAEVRLELDMPGRAQEAMLKANEVSRDRRQVPTDYAAYMDGIQALLQHQCEDAIAKLREAADGESSGTRTYRTLAVVRGLERCERLDDAQELIDDAERRDSRNATIYLSRARLQARRSDFEAAYQSLTTAERLFRDRNNPEGLCEVLAQRGSYQAGQDRLEEALASLEEARTIAVTLKDIRQEIRSNLQRAVVYRKSGDVRFAATVTSEAIALARNNGLEALTIESLLTAANVHLTRSQFDEAKGLYLQAFGIAESQRHDAAKARIQANLASLYVRTLDPAAALEAISAARPFFEKVKDGRSVAVIDTLLGQVLIARAEFSRAVAHFEQIMATAEQAKDVEQVVLARQNLATALVASGRYPEALSQFSATLESYDRSGRSRAALFARLNIADVLSRMGRHAAAETEWSLVRSTAGDDRELGLRLAWVQATQLLRAGANRMALALSQSTFVNGALSTERQVAGLHITACLAASRAGDRRASTDYCQRVAKRAAASAHVTLRLESALTLAETSRVAATPGDRARYLTAAAKILATSGSYEERWRYLAETALEEPGAAEPRSSLTRELDRLRLLWGDQRFADWRARADVATLLDAALTTGEKAHEQGKTE